MATLAAYASYTVFPFFTTNGGNTTRLPLTVPFVAAGLLRYGLIAVKEKKAGTPTEALLTDWQLLAIVGGWAGVLYLIFTIP